MNNKVIQALGEVISALNQHEVEYMVIGGTAVGYYGYQRISGAGYNQSMEITPDLDFWYNPTTKNYYNLVASLKSIGVDVQTLEELVFNPKHTFVRIQKEKYRLEFLCEINGVDSFPQCFSRANKVRLEDIEFYVIGYTDLIKNKEATNREIDHRDIKELKKRNKG